MKNIIKNVKKIYIVKKSGIQIFITKSIHITNIPYSNLVIFKISNENCTNQSHYFKGL